MPKSHATWRDRVRYSELDADGFVRPHRIAEWMQEAAILASTAAGYSPERYQEMGASWLIRELALSMLRPIQHNECVEVETWISDLRRFRSRRQYRVRVGDTCVALGEADWLFLEINPTTHKVRPRIPDPEMNAAFPRVSERAMTEDLNVPRTFEGTPSRQFLRRAGVSQLDQHHHVNHTMYVAWLEDLFPNARLAQVRLTYLEDVKSDGDVEVRGYGEGPREFPVSIVSRTDGALKVRSCVRLAL